MYRYGAYILPGVYIRGKNRSIEKKHWNFLWSKWWVVYHESDSWAIKEGGFKTSCNVFQFSRIYPHYGGVDRYKNIAPKVTFKSFPVKRNSWICIRGFLSVRFAWETVEKFFQEQQTQPHPQAQIETLYLFWVVTTWVTSRSLLILMVNISYFSRICILVL